MTNIQVGSVRVSIGQSYDKLGTDAAAATSDEITYTYHITNNGLLDLYDIGIMDDGLHEKGVYITCTDVGSNTASREGRGAVTGLAAYASNGLVSAATMTCTAKDGVTQEEVRKIMSYAVQHDWRAAYLVYKVASVVPASPRGKYASRHLLPTTNILACFTNVTTSFSSAFFPLVYLTYP